MIVGLSFATEWYSSTTVHRFAMCRMMQFYPFASNNIHTHSVIILYINVARISFMSTESPRILCLLFLFFLFSFSLLYLCYSAAELQLNAENFPTKANCFPFRRGYCEYLLRLRCKWDHWLTNRPVRYPFGVSHARLRPCTVVPTICIIYHGTHIHSHTIRRHRMPGSLVKTAKLRKDRNPANSSKQKHTRWPWCMMYVGGMNHWVWGTLG